MIARIVIGVPAVAVTAPRLGVSSLDGLAAGSDVDRRPFLQAASVVTTGPKVPSFRGMTLRQVLEESSANDLQVAKHGLILPKVFLAISAIAAHE